MKQLNHRKLLDGLFAVCGVPEDKIRTISSAVDKLDKLPWEDVRKEMTVDKGLDGDVADKIGEYVKLKGEFYSCAFDEGGRVANELEMHRWRGARWTSAAG
jgi:histidyl-tRNA synthetase